MIATFVPEQFDCKLNFLYVLNSQNDIIKNFAVVMNAIIKTVDCI